MHSGDNGENGILLWNLFNENKTLNANYDYEWVLPDNYKISYTFSCGDQFPVNFMYVEQYNWDLNQHIDLFATNSACGSIVEILRLYPDGRIEEDLE